MSIDCVSHREFPDEGVHTLIKTGMKAYTSRRENTIVEVDNVFFAIGSHIPNIYKSWATGLLIGAGWTVMQTAFGVPSSYAGYVSMSISFMTIISALISPAMIRRFHTKWIVIVSIALTVLGLKAASYF